MEMAYDEGSVKDPLRTMEVKFGSYDIPRYASVYFNTEGNRCWTKAWFGRNNKPLPSIEISREQAIAYINDLVSKDSWLMTYYSGFMKEVYNSVNNTRQQILSN